MWASRLCTGAGLYLLLAAASFGDALTGVHQAALRHRGAFAAPPLLPRGRSRRACTAGGTRRLLAAGGGVREEQSKLKLRGQHDVWYKIVEPEGYKRGTKAGEAALPLVVLHGGPGVPSDYLHPLDKMAKIPGGRRVFFYDQLGCGLSDEPMDVTFYSAMQTAEDCASMLQHFADVHGLLEGGGFHLLGQSWGGCVATETILSHAKTTPCLRDGLASVVFSGAPCSPMLAIENAGDMIEAYLNSTLGQTPDEMGMRADWPREKEMIEQWRLQKANEKFLMTHNLRLKEEPQCLKRAYSKQGTVWRGARAVDDWSITADVLKQKWPVGLPALVLRGEHDFVTKENVAAYVGGIPLSEYAEARGLSHQAHLEDLTMYVGIVDGYLRRIEAKRNFLRKEE